VWLGTVVYLAVIFGRYAHGRLSMQKTLIEHLERQTKAMERIATELAKRAP
jgi:hypothetical protein